MASLKDEEAYQRYLKIKADRRWDLIGLICIVVLTISGLIQLVGLVVR